MPGLTTVGAAALATSLKLATSGPAARPACSGWSDGQSRARALCRPVPVRLPGQAHQAGTGRHSATADRLAFRVHFMSIMYIIRIMAIILLTYI